ncbi:MAG: SDR family oxidoreductase, partial [Planctomycetes bacterium]|nr:SDR family oxidoreductase [Planctomycetota bacterium]
LTNVTDKASVDGVIKAALDAFGRLDILVNNAGINIPRLLVDPSAAADKEELTEQVWDKVVDINQKGMFLCAQAAARVMLKNRAGVIVNMASESGTEGSEGQSVYASTKAAAYALTRSWAKELGKHGIRVVGVAPGILEATALRSPEYERALAYTRGITVEQLRASYEKVSIPLGRVGKLKEVADLVVFLASERASYVHGTVVNISGGKSRA